MTRRPLDPRARDRYRNLVTMLTSAAAATAAAAVGLASGAAAHASAQKLAERAAARAADADRVKAAYEALVGARQVGNDARGQATIVRQRPTRTVVTTRTVTAASRPGVASVGGGAANISSARVGSGPSGAPRAGSSSSPGAFPPPPLPPLVSTGS